MGINNEGIYGFRGRDYYLSNYYAASVVIESILYPTNEHCFAAMKTLDLGLRKKIAFADSPGAAKFMGRRLELRSDWDQIKDDIMLNIVRTKFTRHHGLAAKLINTGTVPIIEANTWNDRYWGVDWSSGEGLNRLGKVLMIVRQELQRGMRESFSDPHLDGSTISLVWLRKPIN